ncbi:MAG: hypothetical protein QHJ73_18580, partial [Armatimonadota bacterium]|nr:hypothetical protein [Armatimonadota bacterium]
ISLEGLREELVLGKRWVEDTFERPCIGVRSGCGFFRGMQGERERLAVFAESGVRYLSTDLRGPADSIPSGLQQAYWYGEEGFPNLLEMPGHGWHDNVLKHPQPFRLCFAWPPVLGWGIPNRPVRTPEEEMVVQRAWIDRAVSAGVDYLSLVYHPHSIAAQSPDCRVAELLMLEVKARGLRTSTYTALYEEYASAPHQVPGRNAWRWEDELSTGRLRLGE